MIVYMYAVSSWGIIYTCMDTYTVRILLTEFGWIPLIYRLLIRNLVWLNVYAQYIIYHIKFEVTGTHLRLYMHNVQVLLRAPRVIKFTFTADHLTLAQPPTGRGIAIPTVVIELSGVGSGITGPTPFEYVNVTRCLQYQWPYSWGRNRPVLDNTGTRIETRNAIESVATENRMLHSESDDTMEPTTGSEGNEPDNEMGIWEDTDSGNSLDWSF
jgi:hypothetical protein